MRTDLAGFRDDVALVPSAALGWALLSDTCECFIELERRRRRDGRLSGRYLRELHAAKAWLNGCDARVPLSMALDMLSPVLTVSPGQVWRACLTEIKRRDRAREPLTVPFAAR